MNTSPGQVIQRYTLPPCMCAVFTILFALQMLPAAAVAADKPKAVVMTGYNKGAADKAWDDKAAAEAKKDLEAAGYEVELISEASKATAIAKIKDPTTAAVVIIDHGGTGEEKIGMKNPDGSLETLLGSDLAGTYDHIKIATLHACDQNQQSWRDKFPKSDFHSWTGCTYGSSILEWQKKKTYAAASAPVEKQSNIKLDPLLNGGGKFLDIGEGVMAPVNPLSGNWEMRTDLADAFGNLRYNFLVTDNDMTNPEILFGAQVIDGLIANHIAGDALFNPDFTISMTDALFVQALMDPYILLSPGLVGGPVQIQDMTLSQNLDLNVLFAGVRRNIFFADVPEPSTGTIILLGLGLLAVVRRKTQRGRHWRG